MNEKVANRKERWGRKYQWILFFVILVVTLGYEAIKNVTYYPYDSEYYWNIALPVVEDGFHLMRFPETYRGCLFPVLLQVFRMLAGFWGWRILISVCVSVLFAFALPYVVVHKQIQSLKEMLRMLIVYVVFMWIWGDFVLYPLSDLVACSFFIFAIALLKKISEMEFTARPKFLINAVLTGVLLYAAYNTRVAYLYGVIAVLIVCIIFNKTDIKKLVSILVLLAAGMVVMALPQCAINRQYTGHFSPKVYTEALYGYSQSLQMQQVYWGVGVEHYETYVGDLQLYPSAGVYFDDATGTEILAKENISEEGFAFGTWFKLVLKYPFDMMGMYVRHLVSLLTPMFTHAYITNIYTEKGILLIVSVFVWIIAGIAMLKRLKNKEVTKDIWWVVAMFIPPFLQLFGATELRFFLIVYLIGYAFVFAEIDYKELFEKLKGRYLSVVFCSLVIFFLWLTVYGDVLSQNRETALLINDEVTYEGTMPDTEG